MFFQLNPSLAWPFLLLLCSAKPVDVMFLFVFFTIATFALSVCAFLKFFAVVVVSHTHTCVDLFALLFCRICLLFLFLLFLVASLPIDIYLTFISQSPSTFFFGSGRFPPLGMPLLPMTAFAD